MYTYICSYKRWRQKKPEYYTEREREKEQAMSVALMNNQRRLDRECREAGDGERSSRFRLCWSIPGLDDDRVELRTKEVEHLR